jgi:uncharacterized protein (DUF58 family)
MQTAANRGVRFIDPRVVARLGSMELRARAVVEGFLSGLHRSPFKGFSVEFAEYRQYMPGDDLSTMDWKVYARSDRHYVKKYQEETNLECHLLLDVSASMGYGSSGVSKLEYGSFLVAALGYLMNRQRDAVGFIAFDDRVVSMIPSGSRPGHLQEILVSLERLSLGTRTRVSKPLHHLADALSKRGMVILVSDLLDEPADVIQGLKHLRFKGSEVIVFHLLDPAEVSFPFSEPARFLDLENGQEVAVVPGQVRAEYLRRIGDLIETYRRELGVSGIDYRLVETTEPLDFALMSYLASRRRSF